MSETRFDQLIDEVLDGAASPADEERLREAMGQDPALRDRHEEMARLFDALGRWTQREAPTGLHTAVMREIGGRLGPRATPDPASGFRAVLRGSAARYGLVFASGLVVGTIALALVRGADWVSVGGDLPVAGSLPAAGVTAPATTLEIEGARLAITATSDSKGLQVAVKGRADRPFEIAWRPEEGLRPTGVTWDRERDAVTLSPERVTVEGRGALAIRLTFRRSGVPGRPFHLALRSGDHVNDGVVFPGTPSLSER